MSKARSKEFLEFPIVLSGNIPNVADFCSTRGATAPLSHAYGKKQHELNVVVMTCFIFNDLASVSFETVSILMLSQTEAASIWVCVKPSDVRRM